MLISHFTLRCDECSAAHEASQTDMTGEAVRAEAAALGWVMRTVRKFRRAFQSDLCPECVKKRKDVR